MPLKFIPPTPVDEIIPQGSNSLSTRNKFIQNIDYERYFLNFLKNYNIDSSVFYDSRIENKDYGKIDSTGNIISFNDSFIKDFNNSSNIYAASFVVDAFEKLKIICNAYAKNGVFVTKTFEKLEAKSGLERINVIYHEYMNSLYKIFLNYIQTKHKNIINFDDFLKYFIMFLKETCDKNPFIKSSFINSNNCGVNITGLSLEIDSLPKDKDVNKHIKYFSNPDFSQFQKTCQAHGFKIDKYCPWRLVFDIDNSSAQKYMLLYNINKENVFNKIFTKTIDYDIDIMIYYFAMFYNTFITNNPVLEKTQIKNNTEGNMFIEKETIVRIEDMNYLSVKKMYSENFWYKLYFYILLLENKIDINQKNYENVVNSLASISEKDGLYSGLLQFNSVLINYSSSNTKKFIFVP